MVIVGNEELTRSVAQVKNLMNRTQEEVPLTLVEGAVIRLLGV